MKTDSPLVQGATWIDANQRLWGDWHESAVGQDNDQVAEYSQPNDLNANKPPVQPDKNQQQQVREQEKGFCSHHLLRRNGWGPKKWHLQRQSDQCEPGCV